MYYIYVIQSVVDNTFYVGYSENLKSRISDHNKGKSIYTTKKRPWCLIYYEAYASKKDAQARERKLKYHGKAYTQLINYRLVNSKNGS
jgi:putative endonuclease